MKTIKKKIINWDKTSENLKLLRLDNMNLRRYVCHELKYKDANCNGNCEQCKYEMDHNISRLELAQVFFVSEHSITNWETKRSNPSIEDLLFYCDICEIDLDKILVFEE